MSERFPAPCFLPRASRPRNATILAALGQVNATACEPCGPAL